MILGQLPPEFRLFFEDKDNNAENVEMNQQILGGITGGFDPENPGTINLPPFNISGNTETITETANNTPSTQQAPANVNNLIGYNPQFPGQTLSQFMRGQDTPSAATIQGLDPQGRIRQFNPDGTLAQASADFEKASAEREARLAKADEKESTEKSSDKSDNLGAYMELARQEGAKGGAVKLRAQQLKEADERQAAKFEQQSGLLSQLNPTQLTYLMGQLGYDITPKQTETTTTTPITPTETPEFNTKEEADAAGLKIGTRVKIGGRDAIIT